MGSSVEVVDMDQGSVFLDKKSGRQFRLFKYFDHEVIQDVETGWINAGKFVRNVGGLLGKDMDLYDFSSINNIEVHVYFNGKKKMVT